MEKDSNQMPEKKKENLQEKANQWVDKAEAFIDGATEEIHKSETYRKADQSVEKAARLIFRKAGKWWGKFGK
ncbi:MAG: hypothetical protein ACOC0R_06450 [Mariniphaga sp.]